MTKQVVAIGLEVPGGAAEELRFRSNSSLLDADVIVFSPDISGYESSEGYGGKELKTETASAELREHDHHWRMELQIALEHGKTVFFMFSAAETCYVYTGSRELTGTGRSRTATNLVAPYEPYAVLPIRAVSERVHRSHGNRLKPTQNLSVLSSY
jgi:hypothetical protein